MSFLRLLSPQQNQTIRSGQQIVFQWESDIRLASGQALEVVVWRPIQGATAFKEGRGLVDIRSTPATQNGTRWQLSVQVGRSFSGGDYAWGVLLVESEPYDRVRQLSQDDRVFRIESGASGGGSNSSGDASGCTTCEAYPAP